MKQIKLAILLCSIVFALILSSCSSLIPPDNFEFAWNFAEIGFQVQLPALLDPTEKVYVELLDEITGLPFNPTLFEMQQISELEYFVSVKVGINSVLKYRYAKGNGFTSPEYSTQNEPIRYRLYKVIKNTTLHETVQAWQTLPFGGETGTIQGFAVDSQNSAPIPNVLIDIAGMHSWTSSDGSFTVKNAPLGEQRITAIHPNGAFHFFQQGALIATNALTPAIFSMTPAKMVNVTFKVKAPENTPNISDLRLIGDTLATGNTFSDLDGGINSLAIRSPILNKLENEVYSVSLSLPSGSYFRYKFSLSDGFWNAERKVDGSFLIREMIVPNEDTTYNQVIPSWGNTENPLVRFEVKVPVSTPENDVVTIQLNPFTWMPPLPMVKINSNTWGLSIFSPSEAINSATTFRICRNALCEIADDKATAGIIQTGQPIINAMRNGVVEYEVSEWMGNYDTSTAVQPQREAVQVKNGFIKGFESLSIDSASFSSITNWGTIQAAVDGADWIFRSPTWSFKSGSAGITLQPPNDPFWQDEISLLKSITDSGLITAVFPRARFENGYQSYWQQAGLTYDWWEKWFDDFEHFVMYHADLAALSNSSALVIGGSEFWPAVPGASLPSGAVTNLPANINARWEKIITNIRQHYPGLVLFAVPYSELNKTLPTLINQVDGLYLTIQDQIPDGNFIMQQLYAFSGKPIITALNFTSGSGGASCNPALESGTFFSPQELSSQADKYNQAIKAIIAQPWLSGIVSGGFYQDIALIDSSCSVRGKPAEKTLSDWFNIFISHN